MKIHWIEVKETKERFLNVDNFLQWLQVESESHNIIELIEYQEWLCIEMMKAAKKPYSLTKKVDIEGYDKLTGFSGLEVLEFNKQHYFNGKNFLFIQASHW